MVCYQDQITADACKLMLTVLRTRVAFGAAEAVLVVFASAVAAAAVVLAVSVFFDLAIAHSS